MASQDYDEGTVLNNSSNGTAIVLQRGQDGTLKWSDPYPMKGGTTGKMQTPQEPESNVGYGEDLAKNAAPATERAVVGGATSVPTLGYGAAGLVKQGAESYLPPKVGVPVQKGAQATQDVLKPFTYPSVQGQIESAYNKAHPAWMDSLFGGGEKSLYYPKTGAGEFEEGAIQGGLAGLTGGSLMTAASPLAMWRTLSQPISRTVGKTVTGIGAGLGSEAAGQAAQGLDLGPTSTDVARAAGGIVGGRELTERPRKLVTPNPYLDPAHYEQSRLLQSQPGDITTAGQFSGNPKFIQRDANLAPYAPYPYNNLAVEQPRADTRVLAGVAGVPESVVRARGATQPVIGQQQQDLRAQRSQLMGSTGAPPTVRPNTQAAFDPEFNTRVQNIRDEYMRASNRIPDPHNPTRIESTINDIYTSPGSTNTATGMVGGRFGATLNNLDRQIKTAAKGGTNDPEYQALTQLRSSLVDAMDRSTRGGPYAGQWGQNLSQTEAANVLSKAAANPKEAGVLDPNIVSHHARDPESDVARISLAQSQVHKPLPAPSTPRGFWPTVIGATVGKLTGGSPLEGALTGTVSGPEIQNTLLRNPATAGIYYSPWYQARLKNQRWQPSPSTTMDPATVARLLALQKTESAPSLQQ